MSIYLALIIIICFGCKTENTEFKKNDQDEIVFDKVKWKIKDGKDYLYRDNMFRSVIYNDTIRTLNKEQLFELLGDPDYSREGHHYYRITENRLGFWTLTTKTMVIKFTNDSTIEWIKIHE